MTAANAEPTYLSPASTGDFSLLDSGHGFRLERWGSVLLSRPDPQAIWQPRLPDETWANVDAVFEPGSEGAAGQWHVQRELPGSWQAEVLGCRFSLKLTPFKHTGLFPEQAAHWAWMQDRLGTVAAATPPHILNLFAYTGGASVFLTKLGCKVTHVDASRPAVTWAAENAKLSGLPEDAIRWMLDDALKFVKREVRRGAAYDGVILDPPAFGHGPSGQVWKFEEGTPELLELCVQLLSPAARFLVLNGYATNSSALALQHLLSGALRERGGSVTSGELCLKEQGENGRLVSTGIFARWAS